MNELESLASSLTTDYRPTDNDLDDIERIIEQGFLEGEIYSYWDEKEFTLDIIH